MMPTPERVDFAEGSWNDLLDFLDSTRRAKQGLDRDDVADARYLEITRKLVCYFAGRGCQDPDDLATTTVLRVASKCGIVDRAGFQDPTGYFYAVARNVLHEAHRDSWRDARRSEALKMERARLPFPGPQSWYQKEAVQACLDQCMAKLTHRARQLLLRYYSGEGEEKIVGHRALADQFGKSVNALRIEVHRVRKTLRQCVFTCVQLGPEAAGPSDRRAPGAGQG